MLTCPRPRASLRARSCLGLSAHTLVLRAKPSHSRFTRCPNLTSPPSRQSVLAHRSNRVCAHRLRCRGLRSSFDARVCPAPDNALALVIARRSSPCVEHRGRGSLLCIAIAPVAPRGALFAISPLAERDFWSRTRARSPERELIAQPSSLTSRTRRMLVHSPRLSSGAAPSTSRPCSKARASCCSPFDVQPLARVLAHASLPEAAQACRITFWMTWLRARVFEHFCARGGARPYPSFDSRFRAPLPSRFNARVGRTFANISRRARPHALHAGLTSLAFRPGIRSLRHTTIAAPPCLTTRASCVVVLR